MDFETILFEKGDGVATVTLNRPKQYNAFTAKMADELAAAWAEVKTSPDITCAILTASREKAFCTGMDVVDAIKGFAATARRRRIDVEVHGLPAS